MANDNPLYPPLARKFHDAQSERVISQFWREDRTFQKSIALRDGAPDFVFYEGPPTANGMPGVHHVMSRLCKDIMCRYKTMTGYRVVRKAGWDTHGLPVERACEKKLGIAGHDAIEKYGLSEFNDQCRQSVWACKKEWDEFTDRIGYWIDLDDPYITYNNEYIETVWWILHRFHGEEMLYRGQKVVPYCPVCGTPISSHEMANSYQTVRDPSIFVKLRAADADEFFVTWTTTPWTLPSNVALAVGEDFDYVRVRHGEETLLLAEARLGILDPEIQTEVLERFKGRELIGRHYEQLFPYVTPQEGKNAFVVVPADFVTLDTGSGIVHMAPAFGEDDYQIGKRENLAFFEPVDSAGQFTSEVKPWAGLRVKEADPRIVADLEARHLLIREETYEHDYPFHDRCGNPLLYYAMPSWFIKTSAMRERLVAANDQIRWQPPEVGSRRFGNWLEGNVDWSLSRNRFWGTPLNVWICEKCEAVHLPTCRADLTELTGRDCADLDLHRPYVDEITFPCRREGCSGTMRRTPEVIDCWFDAGSMPFAQYHYPFANRELFEKQFPADFISEGIDQTRGWFYTLLVISTFLFGRSSYKSCLVHELVLDRKGKKMSKSVGNVIDPHEILREEGADPLRWYMISASPVWMPIRFERDGVKEAQRKLLGTLENSYNFFALYANIDDYRHDPEVESSPNLLDRWISCRMSSIIASVRADMEDLRFTRAAKSLGDFVIDDLSNWYVRLSRRRFWAGEMNQDKRAAFATLYRVLEGSLRLLAPFIPFTAEEIYRNLTAHRRDDSSVHLTDFPTPDPALQDKALEKAMATAQEVVSVGRALRQDAKLRTRQPLSRLLIHADDERVALLLDVPDLKDLVAEELNIKEVAPVDDLLAVARFVAKPNFGELGPRFGKQAPEVAARIKNMTQAEILALRRDSEITLEVGQAKATFGFQEITVAVSGVAPYVAATGNGLTVAINATLTDDLRDEGLSREIIFRIQKLRKTSGLDVSDRIRLSVTGTAAVQRVVLRYGERIASETLAEQLAADLDLACQERFGIYDVEVAISLEKV
jgi:isoleucyl-tRNA synthetase